MTVRGKSETVEKRWFLKQNGEGVEHHRNRVATLQLTCFGMSNLAGELPPQNQINNETWNRFGIRK